MRLMLLLLLLSTPVLADVITSGNITLLALTETDAGKSGTVAILNLELRPGSERVFLETYPMTKIATQASLRFAQQVACKQLEADCSRYDFLFTIKALPGIVGGPSAGGAATLLTASLLLNKTVPEEIAMTGTINSGGIIGPVGGLKYKIDAASNNSIKTVYIPAGTKDSKESGNTTNLVEYGRKLNLTVKEVSTLGEVLELTLGIPQQSANETLKIEERYQRIMKEVAKDLCNRTKEYTTAPLKTNVTILANLTKRAEESEKEGSYYAAASYCFRANVEYMRKWYEEQNLTKEQITEKFELIKAEAEEIKEKFGNKSAESLGDIQTLMAVLERVREAEKALENVEKSLKENKTAQAGELGYAEERLFSGVTWARFFDGEKNNAAAYNKTLNSVCVAKISEADERYNYVKSIMPDVLDSTRKDIDEAYTLLGKKDYIMCLYIAAKAKAEADVLLSLMGVENTRFEEAIGLKLNVTKQALIKAQHNNAFPIIAYSYYEYASSLRNFDKASSLLFAEYALELANLDIYFKAKAIETPELQKVNFSAILFIAGVIIGVLIGLNIRASAVSRKTLQAPRERRLRGKKR